MKPRHHLYLSGPTTARLEALGARPGTSKSAIAEAALTQYFRRHETGELEDALRARLDRISNQLARIERNGQVLLETLSLFILHELTVTAPIPEADKSAQAVGRERFARFVDQVGRQLALGAPSIETEDAT
ncbi:CopG family transcriptional regulator [Glycocaulis profundi]|nr:CopG family transcriptional regulator [Glycocaulis profundi]